MCSVAGLCKLMKQSLPKHTHSFECVLQTWTSSCNRTPFSAWGSMRIVRAVSESHTTTKYSHEGIRRQKTLVPIVRRMRYSQPGGVPRAVISRRVSRVLSGHTGGIRRLLRNSCTSTNPHADSAMPTSAARGRAERDTRIIEPRPRLPRSPRLFVGKEEG